MLSMDGSSLFGYPDMSDSEEMRLLINLKARKGVEKTPVGLEPIINSMLRGNVFQKHSQESWGRAIVGLGPGRTR